MNISNDTPRVARNIGGKNEAGDVISVEVQVPQPYAAGAHELTEGEASALNQILAENLGNNLRAKIVGGQTDAEGNATGQAHDTASAQELVDSYLADYELGVRRTASGEPRTTDPIEKEARRIARERAKAYVRERGGKPADYDMAPITEAIFTANRDTLMKEAKKIVEASNKSVAGLTVEGIDLTPKAEPAEVEPA